MKDFLDISSNVIVVGSDNIWVHDSGGRFQWVDGWVETEFGDLSGKYGGGVQMREGGGWRWISQIISWYVLKF